MTTGLKVELNYVINFVQIHLTNYSHSNLELTKLLSRKNQ
jgi:hypothetical protein